MKTLTLVIGLIFLGFTNLMYSQNDLAFVKVNTDAPSKAVSNSMINSNYYNSSDSKISSVRIRKFQKVVALYNVKDSDVYSSNEKSRYSVVFEEGDNQIKAEYDQDGKIIHCTELFKNIKLPYTISSDIAKNHAGWEFKEVVCNITYDIDKNQEVIYKVEIQKGNEKKTLKINAEDYNL